MESEIKDVSSIQDEDVLRRMWQQTEDFGRKKEIRAHMYKLREARLKEFYTSGEVLKDVQRSNSSPGLRDQHSKNPQWTEGPTHADSLADHSFLSLKSKEIRDSESPTREVQYRNSKNRGDDRGWTVSSKTERSDDGKTVTNIRTATTQGNQPLDGGEMTYAAANEQKSSVFSDGDANNFTKSMGESSRTFAEQNVTVGDKNNYQTCKTSSNSSSSKVVSHSSSTTGNINMDDFSSSALGGKNQIDDGQSSTTITRKVYTSDVPDDGQSTTITRRVYTSDVPDDGQSTTITRKVYTSDVPDDGQSSTTITRRMYSSDVPDDLKKDIIDGNTKVITETKTLPDGSTVTTTRYETKGSKNWSSSSKSSQVTSSRQVVEQKSSTSTSDNKQTVYTSGGDQDVQRTIVTKRTVQDTTDDNNRGQPSFPEDYPDVNKTESVRIIKSERQVYNDDINASRQTHVTKTQENVQNLRNIQDESCKVIRRTDDVIDRNVTEQDRKVIQKQDVRDDAQRTNEIVKVTKTVTRNEEDHFHPSQRKPVPQTDEIHTTVTTKTTVKSDVTAKVDEKQTQRADVRKQEYIETRSVPSEPYEYKPQEQTPISYPDKREPVSPQQKEPRATKPQEQKSQPKEHQIKEPVCARPQEKESVITPPPRESEPARPRPQEIEVTKLIKPKEEYKPSSPTSDQYSTTYRTEFTNKRISVDVSPTHDAFARSLRAISPDRISDRPKSRGSVSSLRSSTSPEKHPSYHPDDQKPSRKSPDRKPSDQRSPDTKRGTSPTKPCSPERKKFTPDHNTKSSQPRSPERKYSRPTTSPDRTTERITTVTTKVTPRYPDKPYSTDTITKTKPADRGSPEKQIPSYRTPSPTKSGDRSPTKPNERTSPSKIVDTTITTRTTTVKNQSPEKTSPVRGTSPTKLLKSPTKETTTTEIFTVNTDTITKKKKPTTSLDDKSPTKPKEQITPQRSPTKTTETIITTRTVTKKNDKPDDDNKSPDDISVTRSTRTDTSVVDNTVREQTRKTTRPTSRDPSPTTSASDIEFINHNSHIVTDLDEPCDNTVPDKRPTTLEVNVTTTKKTEVTEKFSPSGAIPRLVDSPKRDSPRQKSPVKSTPAKSPVKESATKDKQSPVKDIPRKPSETSPANERPASKIPVETKEKPVLKRPETYEERCRKMLGLPEKGPEALDEYDGMEPVDEPPMVKKYIDTWHPEDDFLRKNVEKITKHRKPEKPDEEIYPDESRIASEIIDFIVTEKEDTNVKTYKHPEESEVKTVPDKKKPVQKKPSPDRKSPEKQVKPKPKDDGEYTTEYVDEYCEKPVPKKPSEQKSPKDTKITSTTITETKKVVTDKKSTSPLDKKPGRESPEKKPLQDVKQRQPQKEPQKRTPEDREFSTEYTDEYCEVTETSRDRIVSKKPTTDQKVPKENLLPAGITEKSPVKKRPDTKSKKQPKSKRPDEDTDDEDTEEYSETEIVRRTKEVSTTDVTTTRKDRKPTDTKPTGPDRKSPVKDYEPSQKYPEQSPKKQRPTSTEYDECVTEYTDKYYEKPVSKKVPEDKIPKDTSRITTEITETTKSVVTTDKKSTTPADRKPGRESPEKKPLQDVKQRLPEKRQPEKKEPQKKTPKDREFTTEYTDEYCETLETTRQITPKKPVDQKVPKENLRPAGVTSPSKVRPDTKNKKGPKTRKPEDDTDSEEDTEEYCQTETVRTTGVTTTGKVTTKETPKRTEYSPDRKSPEKIYEPTAPRHLEQSPTRESPKKTTTFTDFTEEQYITRQVPSEYNREVKTTDFINQEKYDTDITLETVEKMRENPEREPATRKSPSRQLPDKEFDIENEYSQKAHIRTHRIDTTETTTENTSRETSPRRHPQKAVPSDTMECTFVVKTEKITNDYKPSSVPSSKVPDDVKSSKKPQKEDDRKFPVKLPKDTKKDTSPKSSPPVKTTKVVTKKITATADMETKRRVPDEPIKKRTPDDKTPKDKSPERSPVKKPVTKDAPVRKIPDLKGPSKPSARTPSESPVRKPLYTSPATSPDKKPGTKPVSKALPKEPTQPKTTESVRKHVVTKTISLSNKPDAKPQVSPVRSSPKTVTTIKTTRVTQPSTVTVTTVKTTNKKIVKQKKDSPESSDSESEPEINVTSNNVNVSKTARVDKKRVVTTANIKITSPERKPKQQSPIRGKPTPEVTEPTYKRSTSSREPSPDKICPIPVSSEDETGYPRYPDQVSEPDEYPSRRKPHKVTDIPLTEEEDVKDFNRITEVTETITRKPSTRITDIDRVQETDESLLSVTEKVSRFISTAEKLTGDERPKSKSPAARVPRPELEVDEELEDDECLLSVSDKVSKFITTAEQISVKKYDRPQSPPKKPTHDVKVEEDDECLLTVNEKVSHFIQAAETTKQKPASIERAPKVGRPNFTDIDENLKTDECLLSVSDKVSKFLSTAEKLTTDVKVSGTETTEKVPSRQPSPEKTRPDTSKLRESPTRKIVEPIIRKSPKPDADDFCPVASRPKSPTKLSQITDSKPAEPKFTEPKPAETKPGNLKSSEAVRKAKAMFENISKPQEVPKQRDILSRPSVWEGRKKPDAKPSERQPVEEDDVKLTDIGVYKKKEPTPEVKKQLTYTTNEEDICKKATNLKDVTLKSTKLILNDKKLSKSVTDREDIKTSKPIKYYSPEREVPDYSRPHLKSSSVTREDITIDKKTKSTKYSSPEKEIPDYSRPHVKPTSVTREDITIDKKTTLETDDEIPGYMRPIPKMTQEERNRYIIETRSRISVSPERDIPVHKKSIVEHEEVHTTTHKKHIENGDIPGYMRPLQRCLTPERDTHKRTFTREEEEMVIETNASKIKHLTPERDIPGYMRPLQRNAHSPDRDSDKPRDVTERKPSYREDITSPTTDDAPRAGKKFGVTLRRTDSGRMVTTTTTTVTERRRSSVPGQPVIEDIQDLEVLERMMDKVVGYEQRRRIRAQIRVVRRFIAENKISPQTTKRPTKPTSPVRDTSGSKTSPSEPRDTDRKSPLKDIVKRPLSTSPSKKPVTDQKPTTESKSKVHQTFEKEERHSEYRSSYTRNEQTSERVSRERSMSPEVKKKPVQSSTSQPSNQVYKTDLKHVHPTTRVVNEEKPSWVTNRNLKKTVTEVTEEKKTVTPTKKKEIPRRSPSPQKEVRPTDCITSSYGIGPTDENGQPLFGIRALRKVAATDKVQVRGTVVTSQFYSENGQEPVGEVTLTKYSNDPKDLDVDDEQVKKSRGLVSVTTTQKFGTRGTPTLKSIVDKKKAITDKNSEDHEIIKTTSTKVTRRGSVKALSKKFIENAVEISRNERQTYPKAGLILRTSSFKDTQTERSSSRESSPGFQGRPGKISLESITSDSRNSTTQEETKTFLNSHTRVANAQEVITRMKNAEKEECEGDTAEDREARMLLNKFLGAQVLMSGMEPLLTSTQQQHQTSVSSSAHLVRKVQKSKTTTTATKDTSKPITFTKRFQCPITPEVLEDIWDEQTLRSLLEQCTDYEERRVIRARLRQVMAEQEAVANVVANAVAERDNADRPTNIQERVETTKKTYTEGPMTTTQVSTRVISSSKQVNKPISPFAKFRQLDKQNSLNTPPSSPRTPGGGSGAPLFKFTDPALSHSASTVKDRLLHWCQMKTREYQNIKLENFSTCWADGLAFCALIHHFLPDAFDYHALTPQQRRHNFTLAFKVADEQAGIAPLLDVDDMVAMRRPDWKCVFTYVQSIYRRFKDED